MQNNSLFRFGGGIAAILTGLLLFIAHLLNYLSGLETGTVTGKGFVFTAHILAVFAFVAIYEAQEKENRLFGLLGLLLSVVGTIIVSAVVLVEMAGAQGVNITAVFEEGLASIIFTVGPLLFVVGMIFLGISIISARVLPSIGGWLFIIGTIVFSLGSFIVDLAPLFSLIGAAITCGGFLVAGANLLKKKNSPVYLSNVNL